MVKSNNKIRITAMLIILTFVFIPLLSSNVSALVTWSSGSGWTNNLPPPTGPTAGGAMSAPGTVVDPAPTPLASVIFTFAYQFQDSNAGGTGSWHWVTMTVTPGGVSGTGLVFVPSGGITNGVHSSPIYTNVRGTVYTISVTIGCYDSIAGPPGVWWTGVTTCTVN